MIRIASVFSILFLSAFNVSANDYTTYYKTAQNLDPNDYKTIFSGNTVWRSDYELLRMYFKENGDLKIQFFTDFNENKVGDTLEAFWSINSEKNLCINATELPSLSRCYNINYTKTDDYTNGYGNQILFLDAKTNKEIISFNRRMGGNSLLKRENITPIKNNFLTLQKYRDLYNLEGQKIPETPYDDLPNPSPLTKKFISLIEDNIFDAPINYQYHAKNGVRGILTKKDYNENDGDLEKLKSKILCGKWWMHDNETQCYSWSNGDADQKNNVYISCASIHDNSIMQKEYDGIATNSTHYATMTHDPNNFLPLSEFPFSSLFSVCKK